MKQSMSVLTSMSTSKWYTPEWYLNLVREVFQGGIELDPASDPIANSYLVKAKRYFTPRKNDGLKESWESENMFLNPPYSVEGLRVASTKVWVEKAISEYLKSNYQSGIILVNAKVGYKWFNNLLDNQYTFPIIHRDRIAFVDPKTLLPSKPSRQPQASIYLGKNYRQFGKVFDHLGWRIR